MRADGHILVIGGAGVDQKGRPRATVQLRQSNPGHLYQGWGGVARNIAENLARLGLAVSLVSAVGDDAAGRGLLESCRACGIRTEATHVVPGQPTGGYLEVMDADGDLLVAVSDYGLLEDALSVAWWQGQAALFAEAQALVLDLNLPAPSLAAVLDLARASGLAVMVDPTSATHSVKLLPFLPQLYLVTPNAAEASVLCGWEVPAADPASAAAFSQDDMAMIARLPSRHSPPEAPCATAWCASPGRAASGRTRRRRCRPTRRWN
ncbi:MAG: hypothetical protein HC915_20900, partial [Anaerolineae bacterium]|nr:hypothetical protein [Anaerolineae bacterium]